MAQTIKIKRSTGSAAPSTLAQGELAYSKGSDTLYVGDPATANTPIAVGGAIKNNAGTAELATGITAAEIRTLAGVDAAGTDNSTDVTLAGTPDYITISGQTITRNAINLTTDVTGDLPIAEGGTGASTASAARSNLGVDAAGTDNSTNVTLAGSLDYLTISGQAITRNAINLGTDVTGSLPNGSVSGLGSLATLSAVGAAQITDNSVGAAELNVTGNGTSGQALVSDGDGSFSFSTISVTDNDVNVANLTARLPQITSSVTIGDATDVTVTTSGDLTVTGDLTVNGTTTTVSSTNTVVSDALLELANGTSGTPSADTGIVIERGTADNAFIGFDESADKFAVGTGTFTGASTGSLTYTKGTLLANIEGDVTGDLTGNADTATTATTLATGRNFSITGDITASAISFNGSGNVALNASIDAGVVGSTELASSAVTSAKIGSGAVSFAKLSAGAVTTSGETFSDSDTQLMTAAAIDDLIISKGYSTTVGDITSVQISSTDSSISGVGTGSSGAISFDLEVATIDGGTY